MAFFRIFGGKKDEQPKYVVSADVHGLMQNWSESSGYKIPPKRVFRRMTKELKRDLTQAVGGEVEVVSEKRLRKGIARLTRKSPYPVTSLDRAYIDDRTPNVTGYIDLTRAVDEEHKGIGLRRRDGTGSVQEEVGKHATNGVPTPIALADDVIFGGDTNLRIAEESRKAGRPVKQMIAGVAISEGADKIRQAGIPVKAVKEYKEVKDEVCERDFTVGVPMSGRTVVKKDGSTVSSPYLEPFGEPGEWASIPAHKVQQFSEARVDASIALWEGVEKASGRKIPVKDLPRRPQGLPDGESASEALRQVTGRKKKEKRKRS